MRLIENRKYLAIITFFIIFNATSIVLLFTKTENFRKIKQKGIKLDLIKPSSLLNFFK